MQIRRTNRMQDRSKKAKQDLVIFHVARWIMEQAVECDAYKWA